MQTWDASIFMHTYKCTEQITRHGSKNSAFFPNHSFIYWLNLNLQTPTTNTTTTITDHISSEAGSQGECRQPYPCKLRSCLREPVKARAETDKKLFTGFLSVHEFLYHEICRWHKFLFLYSSFRLSPKVSLFLLSFTTTEEQCKNKRFQKSKGQTPEREDLETDI